MRGIIPGGINPNLVSLTGAIVTWWGRIETVLTYDVIGMNSSQAVSDDEQCWPVQIATKRLIKQWARARRIIHTDWHDPSFDTEVLQRRLLKAAEVRHRLVHSHWGWGSPAQPRDDWEVSILKPSRATSDKLEYTRFTIDVESLDTFNDSLRVLYMELMTASMRLHMIRPTPPSTDPIVSRPIRIDASRPLPSNILD